MKLVDLTKTKRDKLIVLPNLQPPSVTEGHELHQQRGGQTHVGGHRQGRDLHTGHCAGLGGQRHHYPGGGHQQTHEGVCVCVCGWVCVCYQDVLIKPDVVYLVWPVFPALRYLTPVFTCNR